MWKASLAFTPSVARLKRRAISSPLTLPRAGSSIWMKSAPASTRPRSSALITSAKRSATSTTPLYILPGWMREPKVSGPAQVALTPRAVWALRYSNSLMMPRPPAGGLGIIKEFEYLKAHTARGVKATCAGPLTFGSRIHPGKMYKGVVDVAERFAEVINAELRGLVEAGADFIQIDEPARGNVSGEEMARLFNLATEGVKAKLAFHICFGNRFGRSRFDRSYRPYFPGVLAARAEQLVLEFAGRELSDLDLWKEYGQDRELGAGVIDVKGFNPESPEDVAGRIRRVLAVCRPEKLYVNPDCGFGWSPRYMCNQKVRALAAGAVLARQQLTGSR